MNVMFLLTPTFTGSKFVQCHVPTSCLSHVIDTLKINSIPYRVVDYFTQGDEHAALIKSFDAAIWYRGAALSRMHEVQIEDNLIRYLLREAEKGALTKDGKRQTLKDKAEDDDLQERVLIGWGREQPRLTAAGNPNPAYREHNGMPMPSFRSKDFLAMPKNLRDQLCKLLCIASEEVKKVWPGSFHDKMRNEIFGNKMRKELGIKEGIKCEFPWEYVDILVTCETGLSRHCDYLNDRRDGYRHCSIYSFWRTVDGVEYKVSIIMTTRTSIGKAMERIRDAM